MLITCVIEVLYVFFLVCLKEGKIDSSSKTIKPLNRSELKWPPKMTVQGKGFESRRSPPTASRNMTVGPISCIISSSTCRSADCYNIGKTRGSKIHCTNFLISVAMERKRKGKYQNYRFYCPFFFFDRSIYPMEWYL